MVKLLVGLKGSGKTKKLVEMANDQTQTGKGSFVFLSKNNKLMYELKYQIRVVYMSEYDYIENIDQYTGFLMGIISSDHDLETIFIDGLMYHTQIGTENLGEFLRRLNEISKKHELEFVISISADLNDIPADALAGCTILD
ncbi:MAG TPA: hypothetical protein GX726_04970 [Clostridiales bacterium]|jgi:thymidine kinase|nr:hypothetical protein [Clostridiales bacterium]